MSALAANVKRFRKGADAVIALISLPCKASVHIYEGAMVAIDSSGNAMPAGATASGTVRVIGVAEAEANNSSGAAAAISVLVRRGTFSMVNATAGEAITKASVGAKVYALDDQTCQVDDGGSGAYAAAGMLIGMDPDISTNVLVEIGVHALP
jgi:hypothetical protein